MRSLPGLSLSVSRSTSSQTVLIELGQVAEVTSEDLSFWQELFSHVGRVVEHGGFSSSGKGSSAPVFTVTSLDSAGTQVRATVRIAAVDVGFWRVLVQLLQGSSDASVPLAHIAITTVDDSGGRLAESVVIELEYPRHSPALPFDVEREPPADPTKNRLVRVVFEKPPDDFVRAECIAALLSWDNLLLGGYPDEGEEPVSNATDATEAYWIDDVTIEHPLPSFLGSEAAFDVVVAMALWFHQSGAHVSAVLIE